MPSIAQSVAPVAASGTALGLTAAGAVGGPLGMAIGAGVGALITLIGDIGSGRRTANTFTENGGPQDIINKQLAAISASNAPPAEKQQATQVAWNGFIQAANQFAAQGPEQAQVAKQAIFQTPALTQTVQSLGGFNPLDTSFTSQLSPSIPGATPQSGVSLGQFIAPTVGAAVGAYSGSRMYNPAGSSTTIGQAANPGAAVADSGAVGGSGVQFGPDPSSPTGYIDASGNPVDATGNSAGGDFPSTNGNGGVPYGPANQPGSPSGSTPGGFNMSKFLPTAISAGTSILGAVIGSNAANSAASVQAAAANHAADLNYQAGQNSLAFQKQVLAQQQANIQPWITAGSGALQSIGDITSKPFTLPTAEEAAQTPGYQFQLEQGQQALDAYLKGTGISMSGAALKKVADYNTGAASTHYQDVVGNALAARNANLNPLLSVAGLGQVSGSSLNSNLTQAANTNANTNVSTAANVGNLQTNAAAATASGYVGSANSWLNALQNIGKIGVQTATPAPSVG